MTPERETAVSDYLDAVRLLFPKAASAMELLTEQLAETRKELEAARADVDAFDGALAECERALVSAVQERNTWHDLANNAEAKLRTLGVSV